MCPPEFVRSVYRLLERTRKVLIVGIFSFIVFCGALEIFLRYTPGMKSLSWSDEIMRYLNIWLIFIAAGLSAKTNTHMAMDFFVRKIFPARTLPHIRRITLAMICAALLALAWIGAVKTYTTTNVMIQAFDIPIAWFYAAIPVGCLVMFVEYALQLIYGEQPFESVAETAP